MVVSAESNSSSVGVSAGTHHSLEGKAALHMFPPDSDASRHEIARMQGAYAAFAGTVQANIDNLGSEFANDNASAWINYGSFLQDNIQLRLVAWAPNHTRHYIR